MGHSSFVFLAPLGRATVLDCKDRIGLGTRIGMSFFRALPCVRRVWSPARAWPKRLYGLGKTAPLALALPRALEPQVVTGLAARCPLLASKGSLSKLQEWPAGR